LQKEIQFNFQGIGRKLKLELLHGALTVAGIFKGIYKVNKYEAST